MSDKLLHESRKSKVFLVVDEKFDRPIVEKVLNYEYPSPVEIDRFYREQKILEGLELKGVRKYLGNSRSSNKHALHLEWFDGIRIDELASNRKVSVAEFLPIAISVVDTLINLHSEGIIHKDLSSANILVDPKRLECCLIDFGISTRIDVKESHNGNPEHVEGTLAYSSPEQTGRVNRVVDYRTDLYTLGISLFELLTGELPFKAEDAMEMVHCHIAVQPKLVHELNPEIPTQVSKIIDKLLSKNAEDRYRSAVGLKADLQRCSEELTNNGSISEFEVGLQDFSAKFSIPQKLYGREKDIETILSAFDRCAEGSQEILMVAGYSGTGKSALVHEVHRPITLKRGYFVEGKFDQYQRNVPYFAIITAFRQLVEIFLTETEDRLSLLKEVISSALGEEGKVLTDVIPDLEHIIGPQPDVPEIGGTEAGNRFNYLMRKFAKAVSGPAHPLVIFIDDLQWADSGSLGLLRTILTDPEGGHLLCIGAYRDNEVSRDHPSMVTLREMEDVGTKIQTVEITNLTKANVRDLISESLNNSEVNELTDLVYTKTQGNAFFVTQFLKSIAENGLLKFDYSSHNWTWDLDQILAENITDNVVELLAEKAKKLPAETQSVLKMGACIGSTFERTMAQTVLEMNAEELADAVHDALKEGLLLPIGKDKLKFSHDRVQQAVYSLIEEDQRVETHLKIGRLLLKNSSETELDEKIFDITNQFNFGIEIIADKKEKHRLSELNLAAGRKAKNNSAFNSALEYFNTGMTLMPADPWNSDYELALGLNSDAMEAAYLCGEFEEMDILFKEILSNAKDILEKVKPYEIRILAYKAENKLSEAIDTGLAVLELLGEKFPKKPNLLHVARDFGAIAIRLSGRSSDDLLNLPVMTDPHKKEAMRIIADITSSVYWGRPTLLPLIVFRMMKISLNYGNDKVSCFAYGSYGVILCGVVGAMKKGRMFGELALDLLEKLNAKEWKAQIYVSPYALTFHWTDHVRTTLGPLQESFHIGLETGLIEFSCVNTNLFCIHAFLSGRPLPRIEEETHAYSQSFERFGQGTNLKYNEIYRQAMHNFMGKTANPLVLTGESIDEGAINKQNEENSDQTGTFFIHFLKLMLSYHFGELEAAKEHAAEARKLLEAVLAKFEIPNHHFYEALTHLELARKTKGTTRLGHLWKAKWPLSKLKTWSKTAPQNFQHKVDLIEAVKLLVDNKSSDARVFFDKAIAGALENEFTHEAALAYELAGRSCVEDGMDSLASYYLKAAHTTYREWGGLAKSELLEQQFPKHITGDSSEGSTLKTTTMGLRGASLDMTTVLKASTTISSEVMLPKLLEVLTSTVMENAGAQKGIVLLETDGNLFVEAQCDLEKDSSEVMQGIPLEGCGLVSEPIVAFVNRTGKHVVVADAESDTRYANDPHVLEHKPKSILCLKIVNQAKSLGILYLENSITTGAFTQERIDLLSLLAGQISVSIDNARLYHGLEQKVEERTTQLREEKQKSDDLLLNILPSATAEELKEHGKAKPRSFESASVLFTDFKGFTSISTKLSPEELVSAVDACFSAFDNIVSKYNIEKIKTIGDAYMCAGGLPSINRTHPFDTVNAAIEMAEWMDTYNKEREDQGLETFQVRIGIHTGPVVAGVVGTKKFAYDIWGDTVNIASRMESNGEAGKVNISQDTFNLVKEKFECSPRGKIAMKNRGEMDMYFVEQAR